MRRAWPITVLLLACAVTPDGTPKTVAAKVAPADAGTTPDVPRRGQMIDLGQLGDAEHPERRVRAWLPPGHDPETPLPVLYVLDGHAASTLRVAEALDHLLAEGVIEPWIAVFVDSIADRRGELAVHAESMADFLAQTVAPRVAEHTSIRSDAAILGYSYGGLAALRAGLHNPAVFARVVAMSPSVWWRQRAVIADLPRQRASLPARLWIDVGTREGNGRQIVPQMVADARALRDAALDRGFVMGRDVGYLEAIGEAHDFEAAGRRMEQALAFALSDTDYSTLTPRDVDVFVYPATSTAEWQAFAIQAQYDGERRLTWPAHSADVEIRGGQRIVSGDLVRRLGSATIAVRLQGVASE